MFREEHQRNGGDDEHDAEDERHEPPASDKRWVVRAHRTVCKNESVQFFYLSFFETQAELANLANFLPNLPNLANLPNSVKIKNSLNVSKFSN